MAVALHNTFTGTSEVAAIGVLTPSERVKVPVQLPWARAYTSAVTFSAAGKPQPAFDAAMVGPASVLPSGLSCPAMRGTGPSASAFVRSVSPHYGGIAEFQRGGRLRG